jgi:hypothetical protein
LKKAPSVPGVPDHAKKMKQMRFGQSKVAQTFDKTFVDGPRDFQAQKTNPLLKTNIVTRSKFNPTYDIRGDIPIIPKENDVKRNVLISTQGPYAPPPKVVRSYVN